MGNRKESRESCQQLYSVLGPDSQGLLKNQAEVEKLSRTHLKGKGGREENRSSVLFSSH